MISLRKTSVSLTSMVRWTPFLLRKPMFNFDGFFEFPISDAVRRIQRLLQNAILGFEPHGVVGESSIIEGDKSSRVSDGTGEMQAIDVKNYLVIISRLAHNWGSSMFNGFRLCMGSPQSRGGRLRPFHPSDTVKCSCHESRA